MGVSEPMSFETWFERIHPNDVERIVRANIEAFKTLRFDETMRIYHPQKQKWIWIHAISTGFEDQERQCKYVNGILIDVTRQKEAEEALRESEKRLNAILDATTETIVLFDSKGIVHTANQIVCDRLETTKKEFIGKRLYDFFPPDVAEKRRKKYNEVFNTGKSVNFEDSRKSMTFEQRAYPVLDEEGQVQMVVAFAIDKTDRKLAEEALRESEEKYKKLFDTNPEAVALVDEEGRFLTANPSMAKRFEEEIEGKTWHELMPKELADSRLVQARQAIKNKETVFFEDARAGRFMENYYVPVPISGEKRTFQVIVRDVTERKQAEEERIKLEEKLARSRKMEAIGTLAGGVAHDLNNILGGLVSYPELLLLQLPEDSPLRKSILTIQKSGEKAAAVVQDLLTLARRGVVTSEVVNLNDVVSDYLESPEHENLRGYHPGVHIETHLKEDTLNILVSSTHLSKTVMNLVANAAEAMPEGGALTVSTENRYIDRPIKGYDDVREGDYVVLTISDTGTGIASDDLEKIFEPFYTKKKMGRSGTGLGMAVVWGTVKDHNGYIHVHSTEGKGTTFTLYFPVTRKSLEERFENIFRELYGEGRSNSGCG